MRKAQKKTAFMVFLVITLLPSLIVPLLPRDFSTWWWNIIVIIAFLSGILFCAFFDSAVLGNQTNPAKFKFFNKKIEIDFLAPIILTPVFFIFLIETKNVLSSANFIAMLMLLIITFKMFKIRILDLEDKD